MFLLRYVKIIIKENLYYKIKKGNSMGNRKHSSTDYVFIAGILFCFFFCFLILRLRFLSVIYLFPLIICVCFLIKYIGNRNGDYVWEEMRKHILVSGFVFCILSFTSKYIFNSFEFLAGGYGYVKTVVLKISDYEKIDFSKNIKNQIGHKDKMNINRDLYIVKKCDEKVTLQYIDEIVGFKEMPTKKKNTDNKYEANTKKYGIIWFTIYLNDKYNLVEIHT